MREMFEHYTSVEDDEPAVQRSEMEDLARRYLDCGDDETGVESRQESGAVTEERSRYPSRRNPPSRKRTIYISLSRPTI